MKKDVYEMVTNRMIEQLEQGTIPWVKPWNASRPFNLVSGKGYSLLNTLCLKSAGAYATFKQWQTMGGRVKKGSKAEIVCFWTMVKHTEKDENGAEKESTIPVLKYYNVFPIECVEFGEKVPKKVSDYLNREPGKTFQHDRNDLAEKIFTDYLKRERIKYEEAESDSAFYDPSNDLIHLPKLEQFEALEEYYSTKAHEFTHSTGHKNRLDRKTGNKFGSKDYAREELTAEMGAAYLLALLGMDAEKAFSNSAAYIQGWIQTLKNDPHAVVVAAGKAEKAINLLLNNKTVEQFDMEA